MPAVAYRRPVPPDPRRWTELDGRARAEAYDARWRALEAQGEGVHGEADLVDALVRDLAGGPATVVDGGCGTGRVAIELARRGHRTVGVDRDPALLAAARAKAPDLDWVEADLVHLGEVVPAGTADAVVLAGNVVLFTDPGTEAALVAACARALRPGGLLVAGFQVRRGGYGPADLDAATAGAGLALLSRWATWDRDPWLDGGDYQVSVHGREPTPSPVRAP